MELRDNRCRRRQHREWSVCYHDHMKDNILTKGIGSRDLYDGHLIQEGMDVFLDESMADDRNTAIERDIEPVIVDVRVDGDDALFQSYLQDLETVRPATRDMISRGYSDSRVISVGI